MPTLGGSRALARTFNASLISTLTALDHSTANIPHHFASFKMSRRSSRKTDNIPFDIEPPAVQSATPKKGRKAAKVENTELSAKPSTKTAKKATKAVKAEIQSDDEAGEETVSLPKPKITKVKVEKAAEEKAPKPKKAAKRKVKDEDDENEEPDEKTVKKKRKTKEEKEAETVPLAARTAVTNLKSAMHIGAHVSGAGGMLPICFF